MNRTHWFRSQSGKLFAILAFSLIIAAIPLAFFLNMYRVAYQQAGIYYASPGDDLTQKVSVLQPGDTLLLNDGVYYSPLNIEDKAGTATAPITIKAVNDGKAIIDGSQITAEWTPPVFIGNGAAYITLEGIVARNAPQSTTDPNVNENVVYVYGTAHDITLRRITAHDAAPGNYHIFYIAFGATNVLVEDCAGWGRGRYIFNAYHASNVTFRRDWAYQAYTTNFSPAPRSAFGVYGSSNVTLENVIGINIVPSQTDDNYYTGTWETSDDPTNYPTDNTKYLGDIFYNDCTGIHVNGSAGQDTQFKDVYMDFPYNATCQNNITTTHYDPTTLRWDTTGSGSVSNVTLINNNSDHPAFYRTTSASINLSNSVLLNNNIAIKNDPGHSYLDFWNNSNNGTTLNSTDKSVDPGFDTSTYGRGAYLFIPQNSPLKGAGQNGADMGANILYEYVNGQLANQPLWPWPMEDRIMAEKSMSVTWEANGGIWKTLSGVYPNMTGTATPNPTLTPTPTVSPTQSVTSFSLINARTNQVVQDIPNGSTIDITGLPQNCLNIRANTNPQTVGSVVFGWDGNANYHTENFYPYDIGGDNGTTPNCWTLITGSHSITATPYSSPHASGTAGASLTVNFTVIMSSPTPSPTPGSSTYKSAVLADSPVIYYRLDESNGTTAADSSGNGHNGTYTTNATLGQTGATSDEDTAISGTGRVLQYSAGTDLPTGASPFSVEVWFKTTATPSAPYGSTLVSWGTGSTNEMFALKIYSSTQLKLTNWTNSYLYTVPQGANTLDGMWHYVVATFDGTHATVYYDSQSLGTQTISLNIVLNSTGLSLGTQSGNNGSPYSGGMDEMAIYNKALSASQVQTHYQNR